MRRKLTYLLLSLCLMAGSGQAFADRNDHRGGKDRQEQGGTHRPGNQGNRSKDSNRNKNDHNKKNDKRFDKNHFDNKHNDKHNDKYQGRPGNVNQGRPGGNQGHGNQGRPGGHHPGGPGNMNPGRPGGPHPGGPAPKPVVRPGAGAMYQPGPGMPPPPPPRLPHMVNYATRGCHDVAVWQVSPDTYLVKYRKGHRWYTRYVYPYANTYGAPTLISVNWQPMSPWTLIPPIQLNINL